jgi:ubiquinone/menaquinone biosynthesis C-methylase UbiE
MGIEYDAIKSDIYSDELKLDVRGLKPIITELIKDVKGKNVLDFGCGSGRFSKIMAESGAHVTALDISEHQIELANRINAHKNITYEIGNESNLCKFQDSSFDLVLLNMVFPTLSDTEEAENIIKEISRVLCSNGRLITGFLHPLFLHPVQKVNDRATDFRFENYFKEGHKYKAEAVTTKNRKINFEDTHFSLNFISNLLEKNSFCIKKIRESDSVPEIGVYVPVYIVFECAKTAKL